MVHTLTNYFMFSELHWRSTIYVILQVVIRYGKWSSIATAGAATALSRTVEGHIRVASSIQEYETGPFNTTADVTIKIVLDRCEYGLSALVYNYNETHCVIETKWICGFKYWKEY